VVNGPASTLTTTELRSNFDESQRRHGGPVAVHGGASVTGGGAPAMYG